MEHYKLYETYYKCIYAIFLCIVLMAEFLIPFRHEDIPHTSYI